MTAPLAPTFAQRVLVRTGLDLESIPQADGADLIGSHIILRDEATNTFVVFVGYPDDGDDGVETWPPSAARRITLPR